MDSMQRLISLLIPLAQPGGCAVDPNYQRPTNLASPDYREPGTAQPFMTDTLPADISWWEVFLDSELQTLIPPLRKTTRTLDRQRAGEEPKLDQAARCQWASTPGNYGLTWCSPAPLYRYPSSKQNESPAEMDMTSFSFLTAGCAVCHPGGGSAEYDREGKRYDRCMSDPASGFTPGGDNNFDGDYYQAKWSESGVLEAYCVTCPNTISRRVRNNWMP